MKKQIKKLFLVVLILALALSATGCVTGTIYGKPLDNATDEETGSGTILLKNIMDAMRADDLDALNKMGWHYGQSDAETFETFWQTWQDLKKGYGLPTASQITESYEFGNDLVFVGALTMEKGGTLYAQFETTDAGLMVGAYLYEDPDTVLANTTIPDGVTEEDVTVGEGTDHPLAGKITYPAGAKAGDRLKAVVLVSGDGANTMDFKAGNTYFYRDLAWGLAQEGIVSIRYDKRTLTYSDEITDENAPAEDFTVAFEYTDDANLAAAMLRDLDFVDTEQVFYAGHSQGAIVAPRADREGGDYAGFILINTSPRPWYDVIYDQYIHYGLIDQSSEKIYYLVTKIKSERNWIAKGKYNDVKDSDLTTEFALTRPAAFWKDYFSFDYVDTLTELKKPTLILQGEADYQITTDRDFSVWQETLDGQSWAQLKSYPGLNHLMCPSQGCFAGHYKEYDMPARASEEVIKDIASFVNQGKISE